MKFITAFLPVSLAFDFSGLLGRIQSETLKFDRMTDEYKNEEEAGIRSVQLRERDIDRSLEGIKMKLHLDTPASFVERRIRHHRRHEVIPKSVSFESDATELEGLETKREEAQKNFLAVEEDISKMPERIMHTKEKLAKEQFEVPLDNVYEEDV